jgi:hypothetical protein
MTLPFLGPFVSSFVFVYTLGPPPSLFHAEPLEAHTETRCRSAYALLLSRSDPFASMSPTAGSPFLQSALPSVTKPGGCVPNVSNPSIASKNPEVSTQYTTPRWTASVVDPTPLVLDTQPPRCVLNVAINVSEKSLKMLQTLLCFVTFVNSMFPFLSVAVLCAGRSHRELTQSQWREPDVRPASCGAVH